VGSKNVRLDEDVYERIKSKKRPDETFSEAIDRLTAETSFLELAGILSDEEAEEMREAIQEQEERSRERLDRLTERMDS